VCTRRVRTLSKKSDPHQIEKSTHTKGVAPKRGAKPTILPGKKKKKPFEGERGAAANELFRGA